MKKIITKTSLTMAIIFLFAMAINWISNTKTLSLKGGGERWRCNKEIEIYEKEVSGIVKAKFIDSANHLYKTLTIDEGNGRLTKEMFLTIEFNKVFDQIIVGDYIELNANSLTLAVRRDSVDFSFELSYNCKDSLNSQNQ